jgi:hypothetical protein
MREVGALVLKPVFLNQRRIVNLQKNKTKEFTELHLPVQTIQNIHDVGVSSNL